MTQFGVVSLVSGGFAQFPLQGMPTETRVVAEVGVVLPAVSVLRGASPEFREFGTGASSNRLHEGSRTNATKHGSDT